MKTGIPAALVAVALSVAALSGCENVTMSTGEATSGLRDVQNVLVAMNDSDLARDAILAARLTDVLKTDSTTSGEEIYVSVSDGHARLSGFVDTAATKLRAGALASAVDGISNVDNRLILRYRADVLQDPIADVHVHL